MDVEFTLPSLSIEDELLMRGDDLSIRAAALIQDTERRMQELWEQQRPLRLAAEQAGRLATEACTVIEQARTHHHITMHWRWKQHKSRTRWMICVAAARKLPAQLAAVGIIVPNVDGGR